MNESTWWCEWSPSQNVLAHTLAFAQWVVKLVSAIMMALAHHACARWRDWSTLQNALACAGAFAISDSAISDIAISDIAIRIIDKLIHMTASLAFSLRLVHALDAAFAFAPFLIVNVMPNLTSCAP